MSLTGVRYPVTLGPGGGTHGNEVHRVASESSRAGRADRCARGDRTGCIGLRVPPSDSRSVGLRSRGRGRPARSRRCTGPVDVSVPGLAPGTAARGQRPGRSHRRTHWSPEGTSLPASIVLPGAALGPGSTRLVRHRRDRPAGQRRLGAVSGSLRLNQIQALGTHNSYHVAPTDPPFDGDPAVAVHALAARHPVRVGRCASDRARRVRRPERDPCPAHRRPRHRRRPARP